ncbi:MAG: methyltransferase domain-containing protein [Rhodospirillales bacterium]|nr:methyltransferase domain-containing protein [Rhodospirillales bacterium]
MRALYGLPDRRAALARLRRASATFDDADAVHSEARDRLLERLPLFRLSPRRIIDLGAATGKAVPELAALYPDARILAVDLCRHMAARAQARCRRLESAAAVTGDAERLPLRDGSIDLIFSNLLLPWCDPGAVFSEAARVLREGGLLLFTAAGPDTLAEVRQAWSEVDDGLHVHGFVDMHDLGDLAARSGLAEPVLDIDRLTVAYSGIDRLVSDLRACGATNVAHGRRASLTGRKRWQAFRERLAASGEAASRPEDAEASSSGNNPPGGDAPPDDGDNGNGSGRGLSISVELIFGQAWGTGKDVAPGTPEAAVPAETEISVEALRRKLRSL